MRLLNTLVLLVIMVGVIGQSVSTPFNNRFIREKSIPTKNSENTNVSLPFFAKMATTNTQSKDTPQFINENKPDERRHVTIAGEKDDFKKLHSTSRRFEKRNKIESTHAKRSLSSPNDKMRLKRMEHNTFGGVKTRIRRNVLIRDTDNNADDYEEYDYNYIDDYEEWLHGSNGVRSTSTSIGTDTSTSTSTSTTTIATPTITANRTTVRKCCPNGQTFLQSRDFCSRSNHPLLRHFHAKSTTGKHLEYTDNSPCSFGGFRLLPHKDKYSVSDKGFLYFQNKILSPEQFCFEAFLDKEAVYPLVCYRDVPPMYSHIIIGKAITIPFLLITLFVYMFIAELHNAFSIAVICHTSTLLFAYIVFIIAEHVNPHMSVSLCRSFAYVIFIMFQTSFFWLNVMCYDLCWFVSMLKRLSKKVKVLLYSCYAWGMPLILTIVFIHRGIVPGIPGHHLKPEYGTGGCRYGAHLNQFYPPVIVLLVCNAILFTITFFKMMCTNRGKLEGQRKQLVQNKHYYNMYILNFKLFLVIGMVILPLIIMWILDAQIIVWYLINTLEIFICISLVCNDNIMNALEAQKYTSSSEFSHSLRQKPQEHYCAQTMEGNSHTTF